MARLPKSIIKKYGISRRAWAVFRGSKKSKRRTTKARSYTMARRHRTHKKGSKSGGLFGGGFMNNALKILAGAAVAVVYEVFVSPMIPLSKTIKNILEFAIGLFVAVMPKMPMMIRAGGVALATINAFELIYPFIAGAKGGSSAPASGGVANGYI
jgi:hypothetical protein